MTCGIMTSISFQTAGSLKTEPSASSLPMEASSTPTVLLQVGVFCVTCGIMTSISIQTTDAMKTEPSASSLPMEASSTPTILLQVGVLCVTCGTITSILFQTPVATPAPRPSVKERKKGPKAPSPQVSGSSPEMIDLSSDEELPAVPANVDQVRHMRNFLDSDSPGFFVSPTLVSRAGRGSRGFVWPSFSSTSR